MLRVILVTPSLGRNGGVATHVLTSAEALAESGFQAIVIAGRREGEWEPPRAEVACRLAPELCGDVLTDEDARGIAALVNGLRPDIVHLHDVADRSLVELLRMSSRVVASAHGYPGCAPNTYYFSPGHECSRGHGPLCLLHMGAHGCLHSANLTAIPRLYARSRRRLYALRAADRVIAYSDAVRRNLIANGFDDIPVVPLFPTLGAPRARPEPGDAQTVVFAGRLVPAKGLDVLIRALPKTRAKLIVCGDGWARAQYESLARRLHVADRTRFLGWVGGDRLASLFSRANVLAVPSVWPEPFGLVGVEAMTCGLATVGSATGGIPEWLDDGETGLLVPPGDSAALANALNQLLQSAELRSRFGSEARRRVQKRFTTKHHVAALSMVYREVLDRKS
jgi:glycosyltransferase involved in cell wall biosynthesis